MTRNDLADLYAIAAMPGLDELAAIIDEHDTVSRRRSNAVTLGFFIVGKAVTGADDQLDGLLRIPTVWALMRQSAGSVGRTLSPRHQRDDVRPPLDVAPRIVRPAGT